MSLTLLFLAVMGTAPDSNRGFLSLSLMKTMTLTTPWEPPGFLKFDIEPDREKVEAKATALHAASKLVIFSDASAQRQ